MTADQRLSIVLRLPDWVPIAARNYLVHTETGLSIRALARASDCHASTILRQVRRFENRRDDPLVDDALRQLSQHVQYDKTTVDGGKQSMNAKIRLRPAQAPGELTEATIEAEGARILRRLCETGAVLAVARDMELAVVVRDGPDGNSTRTATVSTEIAQALALRDWISCASPGDRVAKYLITANGRNVLKRLMAQVENNAQGFGEAPASFAGSEQCSDEDDTKTPRYSLAESPLIGLSRRRDRDGSPFLTRDLIAAGERLREDFELAQMEPRVTRNWESYLTGPLESARAGPSGGPLAAKERVKSALNDLGPGLGDVALRCCCFLEGLEQTEKHLGWAARSGKIVLRIALHRLKRHYEETQGKFGPMIG